MESISCKNQESECKFLFSQIGELWHLSTSENFGIIFTCDAEFKSAMTIVAAASHMVPDVKVFCFEWMVNHFHSVVGGKREMVLEWFSLLRMFLSRYISSLGRVFIRECFLADICPVTDLECFRKAVAYDHCDAYVTDRDVTPFSYRWGTNRYYFNDVALKNSSSLTVRQLRSVVHSHKADAVSGMPVVDGYVPPTAFCKIKTGQSLFRNAGHYFDELSRFAGSYSLYFDSCEAMSSSRTPGSK